MSDDRPLGVFDSGIGGVTVLQEIRTQAPAERCIYFADSQQAPYGTKTPDEIRRRSDAIVSFLQDQNVKAVVVACNAASTNALPYLRERHALPFVGLDPGVKPAALITRSGKIGVLTTPATATSERLAHLIEEYAYGATVMTQVCPGVVPLIERGIVDGPEMQELLHEYLSPILEAGADVVVLGCTHYPLLKPVISRMCGPSVNLIDPSAAVARQVRRVLDARRLSADQGEGGATFYTTGDPDGFSQVLEILTGRHGETVRHAELSAPVA
jgi:glutamate racemase